MKVVVALNPGLNLHLHQGKVHFDVTFLMSYGG